MPSVSRMLSIAVLVLALTSILAIAYNQISVARDSYNSKIEVSFVKSPSAYDYSCNENDYQIYFVVKNVGTKNVTDLSVSITNPLCEGSVPTLPSTLDALSNMSFETQTTAENGTLTISGNNTFVQINF